MLVASWVQEGSSGQAWVVLGEAGEVDPLDK
jgi:hypothetical protein